MTGYGSDEVAYDMETPGEDKISSPEPTVSLCAYCGEEMTPSKGRPKKYCCRLCQQRGSAREYYNRMRDNETFKSKARVRLQAWVEANRERHRKLCLEAYHRNKQLKNTK